MMATKLQDLLIKASEVVSEIDVKTLKTWQQRGDLLVIDVREDAEWQKGHIPGAAHLSKGFLELKVEQYCEDTERDIVLYCGGGVRSLIAGFSLYQMGYRKPISLQGGYTAWLSEGYEIAN